MKTRLQIYSVTVLGLSLFKGSTAFAETPQPQPQSPSQVQRVKIFDDKVFDLSIDKPPPTTSKSGATGTERYLAEEPDYNSGQRNEWLNNCSSTTDAKSFKECFEKQRSSGRQKIKENLNRSGDDLRSPWQGDKSRGNRIPKE